ncbi:MAG TPA: DUF2961 domain-containing protein, partial [Polyangiaceae bacterium]|nr:DUF2961 domain-containing protein [Polyangiaceae bacterium]
MKVRLFLAGSVATCLVVGHARAGDTTLHVTTNGNGAAVLVQETPTGRVEICKPPCDAKVDPNGEYRFVGAPGGGVRESQAFGLPNGPSVDVDLSTRSQIRYVEGFILLGVGGAAAIAGIVMMVVGNDMNQAMRLVGRYSSVIALALVCAAACSSATPCPPATNGLAEPTIPVAFDAFRAWDHWPYLRLGTRAYLRSTYDRSGGNEAADASHYLRLEPDRAVAVDVRGPGVTYFARANHWHGSPWHYRVDGTDHVVTETDTATPDAPTPDSSFIPADVFAPPLSLTWSTTHGADLLGAPIPFVDSLSIGYERTHYGTGYFIFDTFPVGAQNLSQSLASWSEPAAPQDVLDLVGRAGQDIAPSTPDMTSLSGSVTLAAGSATTIFDATGPAMLRAFTLRVAEAAAAALGAATLRVTWDGRTTPSIEAPVSLFFGTGSLFNRSSREYLVKAFPVSVRFQGGSVTFATYFPMPFFRTAHVEIVSATSVAVDWSARTQPFTDPTNWAGYLHASYVDHGVPTAGVDLTLLDTTQVEGGGDWCGSFVGTSFIFSDRAVLSTLEGDPRFFFDDSQTPQAQGTGTEEWGGGGDYWGGLTTTLPFYGHPVGAADAASSLDAEDQIESEYRFLLADEMPFGKNARIRFEHGAVDDS